MEASTNPSANTRTISFKNRHKDIEQLDTEISKLSRSINVANYDLMVLIREFDERAGWLKWSFTDCVSWLKWRCDLSHSAARDKLRIAHALKELPLMSEEFSAGRLSYSKVRALTRVATVETEAELITMAHKMSAAHVEQHCRQRRNASPESSKRARSAYESRNLRSWRNEERGIMTITLEVPIEDGALFEKAVGKAAAQLSADTQFSEARCSSNTDGKTDHKSSWSALQADAATLIARHFLSGDSDQAASGSTTRSSPSADHYQVMVHIDQDALTGDSEQSTAVGGKSELPVETVKRLCCDGSVIPVFESAEGEPLSVGRKIRHVTTAIRRALWARDKGCAFPGCSHTRFVDAHHIKHWADGGETRVENMLLLCTQHHRLVHEGGYSIVIDHAGKKFFKRPDGKSVPECGYHAEDWQDDYACDSQSKNSEEFSCVREFAADYLVAA